MKKHLLLLIQLFISTQLSPVWGQIYNISNTTVTDDAGTLYDSGGPSGNYSNGETLNFSICPTNFEQCILIDFVSFDMNLGDVLEIYDGTSIVASLTKGASPVTFVVYNGCASLRFTSNNFSTADGWELTWTTSSECPAPSPNDCIRSIPVCDNGVLNFNSFGPGNDDFASTNNDNGCLLLNEHQSAWYQIKIGDHPSDGGLLEFVLSPEAGANEDYDFAVYGPNLTCGNLGNPIRCSYADDNCHFCPETGLGNGAEDLSEGAACLTCDGFVAALPVQPGETYYLLIDNFNQSFDGFDLTWGPDVVLDCSILNCSLTASVEAEGETTICSSGPDIQLYGFFANNDSIPSYYWQADPVEAINFLSNPNSPNPIVVADSIPQDFNQYIVYTLTVNDGDCVARANTTVQVFSVPEPPPTDTLLTYCVGDDIASLEISASLSGDIRWYDEDPSTNSNLSPLGENAVFSPVINPNLAATHHFWVTETNMMCESAPTMVELHIFPVPELASIPEQALCASSFDLSELTLTDVNGLDLSEATRSYFVSPDLSTNSATESVVTESGIYWIMVDYFGCIDAEAVIIKLGDLSIEVDTENADCGENNGSATVFTNNGIPPYDYYWSTEPVQTAATAENLSPGIYDVTVEDGTGCILTEQFAIFAPPLPEATVSSSLTVGCIGDTVQLFGATFTAGIDISYLWTGANNFSTTEQNPFVVISEVAEANVFNLVVTVDDCDSPPRSIELFALPTPIVSIINEGPSCENAPITLSADVTASGNGSSLEYYWNNDSGLVGTDKTLVIDNPTDSTFYSVVVKGGTCWSDTVSTLVRVQLIPPIEVQNTSPVCIGESVTLQAMVDSDSENISYFWTGPDSFNSEQQNPMVENPVEGGVYELTTLINGCPSPPITTTINHHSQPELPSSLPVLRACEPPFDLAEFEVLDVNGNELSLTYFNDNEGIIGESLLNTIVEGIDYYWIVGETIEGCQDSVLVETGLFPKPTANFNIDKFSICANQEEVVRITFNGNVSDPTSALFNWDFDGGIAVPGTGAGPHEVRWDNTSGSKTVTLQVIENNCESESQQQNILVSTPLEVPIVTCVESSTNSVSFDWQDITDATNFEIVYTVNNGSETTEIRGASEITVDNLNPDDEVRIEVRALGEAPCGNTEWVIADCKAQNCPLVNVAINGLDATYCSDAAPVNLVGEPDGGVFSGEGVVGNQFFPNQVTTASNITIFYTYTDVTTDCEYDTNQSVWINELPTSFFELSESEICSDGGSVTVTYTGNATTAADFEWDFGGGNAVPGTGIGPHIVDWGDNNGSFEVSLNVRENDCNASPYSQSIDIEAPLPTPEVTCIETSTNSVTFGWNSINIFNDYQITYYINGTLESTTNSNDTQLMVENLNSNDEVEIEVVLLNGGVCGNSEMGTATCVAQECPVLEGNFVNLQTDFCANDAPFVPSATPSGGTFYLEGLAITSIEPSNLASAQSYLLEYAYESGDCQYSIEETIAIHAVPTADFDLSPFEICLESGETATALYVGTAGANATFEWNWNDGVSATSEGMGPHDIEWNDVGSKQVSLVVEENGCRSESVEHSIEVIRPLDTPVVNCAEVGLDFVSFEWAMIADATAYEITLFVNDTQTSIDTVLNGNFSVNNLNVLDEVEIQVIALGGDPCGNSAADSQICTAQDCPEIIVAIQQVANSYCQTSEDIDLIATPEGGVFSGEGVVGNEFQPSGLSAGIYTIDYRFTDENDCEYNAQKTVEIFEPQVFGLEISSNIACKDEAVLMNLTGNLGDIAGLDWLYEQNLATFEDLGNNTFSISWQGSGNHPIGVAVEEVSGCRSFVSSNVDVYELEVFSLEDSAIVKGDSIELTSQVLSDFSDDFEYEWWLNSELVDCDNCASLLVSPDSSSVYELMVTDENGCMASTVVHIEVKEKEDDPIDVEPPSSPVILIPTAFSPNNDGINDLFQIEAYGIARLDFAIFNRWGKKVFVSQPTAMDWDGSFDDELQPIGTYVYSAIVTYEDGSQKQLQGNLTLIR